MIPTPLKKMQKRLSKTLQSAGSFMSSVGATPSKQLRLALLDGNEEQAIGLYTSEQNGKRLSDDVHPSQPFQSNKWGDQTPLHVAASHGLQSVVLLFLEHGGNPEELNGHAQTCLHCVCMGRDHIEKRHFICNLFLEWKGQDPLFGEVKVSVNHVDEDGNIALHYAARNGLLDCVQMLLQQNSVISLVNKDQMTCCDEADAAGYSALADMLEAALVFQPFDDGFAGLDVDGDQGHDMAGPSGQIRGLVLDAQSMSSSELYSWAQRAIGLFREVTNLPVGRVLAILGGYDWNVSRALQEYVMNPDSALKSAHLETPDRTREQATSMDPEVQNISTQLNFGTDQTSNDVSDELGLEAVQPVLAGPPDTSPAPNIEAEPSVCPICCVDLRPTVSASEALQEFNTAQSTPGRQEQLTEDLMSRALPCHSGHSFCVQCWITHSTIQVNEMGAGVLQCPGYKCNECIDDAWASVFFPSYPSDDESVLFKKLRDNKVRRIVDRQSSLMWCPVADCGCIVILPSDAVGLENNSAATQNKADAKKGENVLSSTVICGRGHAFCTGCNEVAHSPCSCSAWMKWQVRVQKAKETADGASDGSDLANALWVAANTKRCPKCKLPIEKNEGCNHMTCRKCRYEFCWVCMQDWSLHSQNTGGYFQCNRFVANDKKTDDAGYDMGDEDEFGMGIYGDVGSSRREDMLARRAGMRMERFLHHYTRFQSHDDSSMMEARMHMETMERLCRILMSSLDESEGCGYSPVNTNALKGVPHEKLCWLQTAVENPFSKAYIGEATVQQIEQNSAGVDRLLVEELRILRRHQSEIAKAQEATSKKSAQKDRRESNSWLSYVRNSLSISSVASSESSGSNLKVGSDKKMPALAVTIDDQKSQSDQVVPSILLFAAKGDLLENSDFSDSFGLGEASSGSEKSNSMIKRLRGLDFLQNGFRELLKCRQLLKGSFAFAFYYFDDASDGRHSRSYGRDAAIQSRKLMFEQGQADLNARTETLSDVVARRRLRASRSIIDQATRTARASRMAFENILRTCSSEIDADFDTMRMPSSRNFRPGRSAQSQVRRRRMRRGDRRSARFAESEEEGEVSTEHSEETIAVPSEESSSEYLDRQLRLILQSLDDLGSHIGSEAAPPAPPPAASSSPSRSRGAMGPSWSPSTSESLGHAAPAIPSVGNTPYVSPHKRATTAPIMPPAAPMSSHSPPRKSPVKASLASHPDQGFIEALRSDGLSDDQIRNLLGIFDEPDDTGVPHTSMVQNKSSGRIDPSPPSPLLPTVVKSSKRGKEDSTGDKNLSDVEEDMNMAILLSIQDPRLNDLTLRGDRDRPGDQEASAAPDVTGGSASSAAPSNENIMMLTSMGFTEEQAAQALSDASNDVEVAVHTLLSDR